MMEQKIINLFINKHYVDRVVVRAIDECENGTIYHFYAKAKNNSLFKTAFYRLANYEISLTIGRLKSEKRELEVHSFIEYDEQGTFFSILARA